VRFEVRGQTVFAGTGGKPFDTEYPSVVFVHGAALDHSVWALPARYFAHHGRNAVALDLPGHGRSEGDAPPSIEAMAAWVVECMDALGISSAPIVGHSMGSLVALELAAAHPDRSSGAALLGTAVPMLVSESLLAAAEANDHSAFDMINLFGHSYAAQIGGNAVQGLWMSGAAIRLLERSAPGVLYSDFRACNNYTQGLESAAKLQCPALLVLGEADLMTPPRATMELRSALPEVETVLIPGAGHMMIAEAPDQTLDALLGLVNVVAHG
jgi:pimeloyl-ACP methyl ester carboxylesterase